MKGPAEAGTLNTSSFLHYATIWLHNAPVTLDEGKVFKALADPSRRRLLDMLHASNGQTLTELCEHLDMTRQAVTKHLLLLETANLVVVVWRGREKLHYLNPVPISEIFDRWVGKYERRRVQALNDLKRALEEKKDG
jgi:DNA-binding transcriptional ArsR family regulator